MATTERAPPASLVLVPFAIGAALSVALGAYGRVHDATFDSLFTLFFSDQIQLKAWFATVAMALGAFQLVSALRLYGKLKIPKEMPSWFGDAHRLSGTLAFLFSLPVAYHCLWALGFQSDNGSRVLIHSILGCAFYGAFVAKVVIVRNHKLPGWALPLAGGLAFAVLVLVWYTSSLWLFTQSSGLALF